MGRILTISSVVLPILPQRRNQRTSRTALVRYNAALSLAAFRDPAGRDELRAMLQPKSDGTPPPDNQVWEALRALFLVGTASDLDAVTRYARGVAGMPARIQQQALLTAREIENR
jgi:hypothetical protein